MIRIATVLFEKNTLPFFPILARESVVLVENPSLQGVPNRFIIVGRKDNVVGMFYEITLFVYLGVDPGIMPGIYILIGRVPLPVENARGYTDL